MHKTTLPALLRNGYPATAFYQSLGITIESSDGFDAHVVLPTDVFIKTKGSKTTLYQNENTIGFFDSSESKVRFNTATAVAAPKKRIILQIVEDTEPTESQRERKQRVNIINVVASLKAEKLKAETPTPQAPKAEPLPQNKTGKRDETKKALFGAHAEVLRLLDSKASCQQMCDRLGVSKTTLYKYLHNNALPLPTAEEKAGKPSVWSNDMIEKWVALATHYGSDIDGLCKASGYARVTVYDKLAKYVPKHIWRTKSQSRGGMVLLGKDFWIDIYKKHNGNFDTIATELNIKVNTAKTYYYNSGAGAEITTIKNTNKVKQGRKRTPTPKVAREPNKLEDKALWEALMTEHKDVKSISLAIGKSTATCYVYIHKYLPTEMWKKNKPSIKHDTAFWLDMWNKHQGDEQAMAAETGFTANTVHTYMQNSGAASAIRKANNEEQELWQQEINRQRAAKADERKTASLLLAANKQQVIDMLNQGATAASVARTFNVSNWSAEKYISTPEITSQIHYIKPKGAASYELRVMYPKVLMTAATKRTKVIKRLALMLGIDTRTVRSLMIAYEIPFKEPYKKPKKGN